MSAVKNQVQKRKMKNSWLAIFPHDVDHLNLQYPEYLDVDGENFVQNFSILKNERAQIHHSFHDSRKQKADELKQPPAQRIQKEKSIV